MLEVQQTCIYAANFQHFFWEKTVEVRYGSLKAPIVASPFDSVSHLSNAPERLDDECDTSTLPFFR